jgi:mannose-1-phosphate guanylyltransferase
MERTVFVVVLAGGSGTRFWPASRARRPKQLLPLTGGEAMLRETIRRVLPLVGSWDHVLVAGGRAVEEATRAAIPELPGANLLVEPVARNTAPCIAWAAATIARRSPDAVVVVLPSDHHIADEVAFRTCLEAAIASAEAGVVTTIGIRPTRPDTGFGYLEIDASGSVTMGHATRGLRFVEKPALERARAFVAGGRHLWNGGMFIFRAGDMVRAVAEHQPAIAELVGSFDAAAARGEERAEVERGFAAMPSVSVDVGVMEKLAQFAVIPGDFGWSDVGSWEAAWELADKDALGNAALDTATYVDATGNLVVDARAPGAPTKTIALVGVRDLVVVETDDALLVVPRERCQDVRAVVESLKAKRPEHL